MPLVLIIDDNEKNRKLARDVLGAAGFRRSRRRRTEGIMLAAAHLPDVILMDLRLPDMNGADAAEVARGRTTRTARIPVVAMSALSFEDGGDWLEKAGFAGCDREADPCRSTFPEQVGRYCTEPSWSDRRARMPC